MAALPQCDAFGFIYDPDGTPDVDKLVVVLNVVDPSGSSISFEHRHTFTDDLGQYRFTLPQGSTAYLQARASGLWAANGPVPFAVPNASTGELVPTVVPQEIVGVTPPLVLSGSTLSINRATTTQDGYLAAEDFALFTQGAAMDTIPGVAGTWPNPTSITVNAYGQIIAITAGTPDITAPVISAIGTTGLSGTGVTVTWTTNEPANSQVDYGSTTSYGASTTLDTSPVLSHSVPITGLAASTLYHYRVKSRDTAGNLTTSADNTFTTTAGPSDTTPPVITGVNVASLAPTSVTVAWTTDELADSQVDYGPTTSYGTSTTLNPSLVLSHSVPISGLTSNTLFHFRVKSRDSSSNLATSADFTFTTPTAPDTTPPGISAVMATSLTETDVTIIWTTDEASDSQVEYGPTTAYGTSTALDGAMVTSHSVPITGLTGSTLYHYRVKSRDASSNLGTSIDYTFTTLAPGSDVNLLDQLVSYWKMDVLTAGVTPDVLGNNNLTAQTLDSGTVTLIASGIGLGNEINFAGPVASGEGATLVAPDHPSQHFAGSFSIAGWLMVHYNDGTQIHTVLAKGGIVEPHQAWALWYNEYISKWEFVIYTDGTNASRLPAQQSMAPVMGTYYFIAGVYDATAHELRLSINGLTPVIVPFTGTVFSSSFPMNVGYPGDLLSNCAVDEIGLWSRALNAHEITALYNGGAGKTHPFT